MTTRRGAAKGTGRGYRNLRGFPKDPFVHSQSAKGRKQPQKIQKIIIDQSTFDGIRKAERRKDMLVNKGYGLIDTKQFGLNKFVDTYIPEIKGWKDTSKTHSDEWRSKDKKVNVLDNTQFGSGWVVSVTSLKKDEPPQLMSDTNNTKEQAYRKAIKYMQENR